MHSTTLAQPEQPNNLARQQQGVIRFIGSFLGRTFITVGAALTMRFYIKRRLTATEAEEEQDQEQEQGGPQYWIDKVKEEASVAAATVLAWKTQVGSETGANVGEYLVERANYVADQNYAASLPPYAVPKNPFAAADRVTDSLLWRFANYAATTFPDSRIFSPKLPNRSEPPRFTFFS